MNQLLNTIEKAKDVLNISERELSVKIGQHFTYLSKIKKNGTSEKNQKVIIEKIVNLMNGNPVTDAEIIESLSLRLQVEQHRVEELNQKVKEKNIQVVSSGFKHMGTLEKLADAEIEIERLKKNLNNTYWASIIFFCAGIVGHIMF